MTNEPKLPRISSALIQRGTYQRCSLVTSGPSSRLKISASTTGMNTNRAKYSV